MKHFIQLLLTYCVASITCIGVAFASRDDTKDDLQLSNDPHPMPCKIKQWPP